MKTIGQIIVILLLTLCMGCSSREEPGSEEHIRNVTAAVDHGRILAADDHPGDWLSVGRNYAEDRFSSLEQINKNNVNELGLAWSINLGIYRGIEATPIVVDGIMYVSGPWSIVYAIDVRKGEIIWIYDPEVPREFGVRACCDVVNRGVSMYMGLIFVGTIDGRLVAIEAATGELVWETLTVDHNKAYTITGATRVFDGKVLIGNSGAEYGVRGYVSAYDALSGELLWRFYTVPGNPADGFESEAMEVAASTWTGEWWTMGGGGTVWDAIVYDPELELIYIGTGNGSPWNHEVRSPGGGDNLYLSSVVALNPDNGELVWYYQQIPGETFDFTATQPIILADLEIKGEIRKVLMQAPKNGFFYVLDRTNGEFISGEPYVYVNWASGIDYETGRPVETEHARHKDWAFQKAPSAFGAHNWQPMSYNPTTGLVYIPAREEASWVGPPKDFQYVDDARTWNTGNEGNRQDIPRISDPNTSDHYGKLIAWDPVEQREVWSIRQAATWNGGVLSTNDLIFQGDAEGKFKAFDATSGEELWSYDLGTGIIAAPCTYMVDGIQYISLAVGWGGAQGIWGNIFTEQINPGTVYTFAMGKRENPPHFEKVAPRVPADMEFEATPEQISNGKRAYWENSCFLCHGGGIMPELSYSSPAVFDAFEMIVGKGAFLGKGMPSFEGRIPENDIRDMKLFLMNQAKTKREARLNAKSIGLIGDALPTGWREDFPLHKKEGQEGLWEGIVSLEKGELKIRANNDWEHNWGGVAFPEGFLYEKSANIRAEKGTYQVTVNLLTSEYVFNKVSE